MQLITNQTFGGERSLYKLSDAKLDHVTILAGDSPIKHGTNLTLTNCDIEGKYPLWINTNTVVDNCLLKVTARSGLWYLKNFKVTNTRFECPKSFRDSDGIEIRDCTFTDAQETLWSCRNVLVEKSSFDKGDYLLAHSSDIRLKNIKLNGNYLGQWGRNIEERLLLQLHAGRRIPRLALQEPPSRQLPHQGSAAALLLRKPGAGKLHV